MRHIITETDKTHILNLYDKGHSKSYISIVLELPINAVSRIIKNYTGHYTEIKVLSTNAKNKPLSRAEIEKREIISLYNSGKSIKEISEGMGIIDMYVEAVLRGARLLKHNNDIFRNNIITIQDLKNFRDYEVKVGNEYVIQKENINPQGLVRNKILVKVLKKYPFIVETDKGFFKYFDLYKSRNLLVSR